MKKTAFILMVITVLSKVIGFARDTILAYFYGTGVVADAFVIAFSIPVIIFNFISTGVNTGMIPMVTEIEKNKGREETFKFTSNLFNLLLIVSTILFVLGLLFTTPLVKIFALGFTGEKLKIAVLLTRLILIALYGLSVSSVYRGYLQYHGNFVIPGVTGFVMNVFTIAAIVISAVTKNLVYLGIGAGLGQLLQYVIFIPAIKKTGYKHSWILDWKEPHIKQLTMLALPIIMGVAVSDLNNLVDRNLASIFAENGVSVLNYANRLIGFVSGIVIVSIVTAVFPTLSRMASERNIKGMKTEFASSISILNLLVIPAIVGFILFAQPIVGLLFGRGQFTQEDVRSVGIALAIYAPSLIGIAYRDVMSRMFYSLHDTKTPAVNSVITVVLNIGLSILFAQFLGIYGLALGTTISTILGMLLFLSVLRYRLKGLALGSIAKSTLKVILSTVLMGAASYGFYYLTMNTFRGRNLQLLIAIAIALLVYTASVFILGVNEAKELKDILLKRTKKA